MTSVHSYTLGDLMGNDHTVYMKKNKKFGVDLEIQDEDQNMVFEDTIHPFAAESFADFCRQFLHHYEQMKAREELTEAA